MNEEFKMHEPGKLKIRLFDSGATRDTDQDKLDYEGFLSPFVLERYAEYLHKHRKMSDGSMRASDNWQKGMPVEVYMKSACRHFFSVWKNHRRGIVNQDEVCALLFNIMGILFESLNVREVENP